MSADGGPAFPIDAVEGFAGDWRGMSLRDYFAAKALQGWLASYGADLPHPTATDTAEGTARQAYDMADAMLKARAG